MVKHVSPRIGDPGTWPRSPDKVLDTLERLIQYSLLRDTKATREELAVLFPYAQYLVPTAELSSLSGAAGARLVRSVRWHPDGRSLATCGNDGSIKIWDAGKGYEMEGRGN